MQSFCIEQLTLLGSYIVYFLKYLYFHTGALLWPSFSLVETQEVMLRNLSRSCKSMAPRQCSCAEDWQITTLSNCLRSTRTKRILSFSLLDMTCNKLKAKMLLVKILHRSVSSRMVFLLVFHSLLGLIVLLYIWFKWIVCMPIRRKGHRKSFLRPSFLGCLYKSM
jgi:hypothetical protein